MAEMTTTLTGFAAATIEKKRAAEAVQEGAQAATGTAEYTFDVSHMDLFYNEFQALKDINMKIRKMKSQPSSARRAVASRRSSRR